MAAGAQNGSAAIQRWFTIGAIVLGLIAPILGGAWWLSNLNGRVSALENQSPRDEALTQSKLDDLTRRVNTISANVQGLQIGNAENCRQLSTVEVQMGTVEAILNKTQVVNQRDFALLWNKAFGQVYPDTFYAVTIPHDPMPCLH